MTEDILEQRIERCDKTIKQLPCGCLYEDGYWQGRKEVYEEWLEELQND